MEELLSLGLARQTSSKDIRERVEAKIADIDAKIRTLAAMKKLQKMTEACSGCGPASECPPSSKASMEKNSESLEATSGGSSRDRSVAVAEVCVPDLRGSVNRRFQFGWVGLPAVHHVSAPVYSRVAVGRVGGFGIQGAHAARIRPISRRDGCCGRGAVGQVPVGFKRRDVRGSRPAAGQFGMERLAASNGSCWRCGLSSVRTRITNSEE